MYYLALFVFFLSLLFFTHQDVVAKVDAFNQLVLLQRFLYPNFVGVTMPYDKVYKDLNKTLFQEYLLNSKMYNHSQNLWTVSLKMPFGWKYDCSIYTTTENPYVSCIQQLKNNNTLFDQLAYFAMNVTNIPLWSLGYDYQFLDSSDSKKTNSLDKMLTYIYDKTNNSEFGINYVNQGDIAVQKGYYLNSFTPDDFYHLAYYIQYVFFGMIWTGPGVTMAPNYTDKWVQYCLNYRNQAYVGVYTFNLVIFQTPQEATLENLLSENYTKGFLQKRFGNVTNFGFYDNFNSVAIYECKLMEGAGIDGVTNSFASIIWLIDFCFELAMYDAVGISMAMEMFQNNYQAVLEPFPYKPKALYYGLLFMSMIIEGGSQIGKPGVAAGTSRNFKVWVIHTGVEPYRVKLIFLNKDTNVSLNGTIRINIVQTNRLSCMYLQAQNLNSTEDFKFAGYTYEGNNSQQLGQFQVTYVNRDFDTYFYVPIKYGQIGYCEGNYSIDLFPQGPNPSKISTTILYADRALVYCVFLLVWFAF